MSASTAFRIRRPTAQSAPEVVLGLDCAQPRHRVARPLELGPGDALVIKSAARHVESGHDSSEEEIAATFINGI